MANEMYNRSYLDMSVNVVKQEACMLGNRLKTHVNQQSLFSFTSLVAGGPFLCSLRKNSLRRHPSSVVIKATVKSEELIDAKKIEECGLDIDDDDKGLLYTETHIGLLDLPLKDLHTEDGSTTQKLFSHRLMQLQRLLKKPIFTKLFSGLSPRIRGVLLLNFLTFLYGSNIPVIKNAETLAAPHLLSLGRFVLAAIAFSPFVWQGRKDKDVLIAGVELGCWISIGYLAQGASLFTIEAGRASFISAFTVIVVPILAGLSGAKISKLTWGAAGAALIGVGLLESTGSPATVGDLWSIISALFFGIHMLRTEHYSRELPSNKTLSLVGIELLIIMLCSIAWSLFSTLQYGSSFDLQSLGSKLFLQLIGLPWFPVIYMGLFSTALCLWIEVSVMRDVSASDAAIIYSLEPLWGAGFAWCYLGERWGALSWLGALLILGGSVSVQLYGASSEVDVISKDILLKLENMSSSLNKDSADVSDEAEDLQKPQNEFSQEHVVLGGTKNVKQRRHR